MFFLAGDPMNLAAAGTFQRALADAALRLPSFVSSDEVLAMRGRVPYVASTFSWIYVPLIGHAFNHPSS